MREELVDRFGPLPVQARTLVETHRLRILARPLGIAKIDASKSRIQLQFAPDPPIEPARIIELVQRNRDFKLAGPDRLVLARATPDLGERAGAVRELIQLLSAKNPVISQTAKA
jgi:transcription-repair coupling factor (superfamily II helicase)